MSTIATTSLSTFLTWLQSQRFTGNVVLHCQGGVVKEAHYGAPNRVMFTAPTDQGRGAPHSSLDNSLVKSANSRSG